MSYTPTEWKTGDIITAEKLNKLENGISSNSSVNVVFITEDASTHLDKTAGELYSMFESNNYFMVVIRYGEIYGFITKISHDHEEDYAIQAAMFGGGSLDVGWWYTASSADSYPVLVD